MERTRVQFLPIATGLAVLVGVVACENSAPGSCGDGLCRPAELESCSSCPRDCGGCGTDAGPGTDGGGASCGDGLCNGSETCASCGLDCGACPPGCGDGACNGAETCTSCSLDCGACGPRCGDGVCSGTDTCSSCPSDCGTCPAMCTATSCGGGCCLGTACRSGDEDAACGSGGAACLDCGSHGVCTGGACFVDPDSLWDVVVETLTVTAADYSGAPWDVGSGPDPFIWVRVGSATAPAVTVDGPDNTLSITFTAGRIADQRAGDIATFIRFEVWEDDTPGDDGVCFYTYTSGGGLDFSGARMTARCVQDAGAMISEMTMTWHLEES